MNFSTRVPAGGASKAPFAVVDLRSFLDGTWLIHRRISDFRRDEDGLFEGGAIFAPDGGDLIYREQGTLTLSAYEGEADQCYRFRFPAIDRAEVWFVDGRFFHTLDLKSGRCTATHQCGDDLYVGRFSAVDWTSWQVEWRVTGPRKNIVLNSTYSRSGRGFPIRRNRTMGTPEDPSSRSA